MAVPLLVYVVGGAQPHLAIGASAVAVAVNAALDLVSHARAGAVKWRCALTFALAGAVGALAGSTLGKLVNGRRLIVLFALLMLVVGAPTLARRGAGGDPAARLNARNAPTLIALALAAGALSGFFGVGGGFLIVPALIAATGMTALSAIGSSPAPISVFGAATAFNYARDGLVDWGLAAALLAGGLLGAAAGARAARVLSTRKSALTTAFVVVMATALAMLAREWSG